MGLEREVARIEETNYRTGYIASERLSTARQEEGIVLPPHRQEAGKVTLPLQPKFGLDSRAASLV
jgi:hypothetical protein